MTRPGIEPRSPGPLANTLTAGPMSGRYINLRGLFNAKSIVYIIYIIYIYILGFCQKKRLYINLNVL